MPRLTVRARNLAAPMLLGWALAAPAGAGALPDYPFVHVTGSAMRWGVPDIAALDFEIVAADADPAAARAVVEARVADVRALAQQAGMSLDDVTVREVRQGVRKESQDQAGGPVYELRCDVHLMVRDVAQWPALAGGLLGKPNLDGFGSSFDASNVAEIEAGLMQDAIADARRRAEAMAAGFGARVAGVAGATPESLKGLTMAMGLQAEDYRLTNRDDKGRKPAIGPNPVLVVPVLKWGQAVDVVFRLDASRGARRTK